MNNSMYPCLWFDGQAKAAADFYCEIFKNSSILSENPMVVMWEIEGKKMMGLNGGPMFKINPSISIFVTRNDINELNEIWNQLSEGGKPLMPIDKYDWSERYGWIQDKFGMTWQIMLGDANKIIPAYLFTNTQFGEAETAMNFYTSVFENSSIDRLEHYPDTTPFAGKVMYAEFNLNQYPLIAMDGPGEHNYTFNEALSFVVNCETQDEIDYYWNKLTEGGEESMCGWLKDKQGVSWQIVPSILGTLMSDAEKAPKVIEAFMQMKKFDIQKLLDA